jgi:hypothetical protein
MDKGTMEDLKLDDKFEKIIHRVIIILLIIGFFKVILIDFPKGPMPPKIKEKNSDYIYYKGRKYKYYDESIK